jgi:putative transcriptional regulator
MNSLKGHLLAASPRLADSNFFRTVILMIEDNEEGSAGLVVNRPTEATISGVSEQIFQEHIEWEKPIYLGGPVPGPLVAFHTAESLSDQEIVGGVYSTADPAKLQMIAHQQTEPSLFVANYAGWGPGQLAAEIDDDSWLWLPARPELIFWSGEANLWNALLHEINAAKLTDLLRLREMPDDPSMN